MKSLLVIAVFISLQVSAQKTTPAASDKKTTTTNNTTTNTTNYTHKPNKNNYSSVSENKNNYRGENTKTVTYRQRSSKETDQNSTGGAVSTNQTSTTVSGGTVVAVNSNEESPVFPPSDNSQSINNNLNYCSCEGKILITNAYFSVYTATQIKQMLASGEYCLAPNVQTDLIRVLFCANFWINF